MVDIVDSDSSDIISQKLSRIDSRSKPKLSLPKRLGPPYNSSKYFLEDHHHHYHDKDSPTFSPLNSVQNKNKKSLHDNNSGERNVQDRFLKLNQFNPVKETKEKRNLKYDLELSGKEYEKYRRDEKEIMVSQTAKYYQPEIAHHQNGMFRRARCSSYFMGKENIPTNLNYSSSNYKREAPLDSYNKYGASRVSDVRDQEIAEVNMKNKQISKQNQDLKNIIKQLKIELKISYQKQTEYQKIVNLIMKQSGQDIRHIEGIEQFVKKCQRNQSFVNSIIDMKTKTTGKSQNNLKDLWRWLKGSIQELGNKREITDWIKEDYLMMSAEDPDELIRLRLMEKLRR